MAKSEKRLKNIGFLGGEKMKYDLKSLTTEEKLRLLTGKDSWRTYDANGKVKEIFLSDGPNGLRKVAKNPETGEEKTLAATAMPTISVLANSWNRDLAYLDGKTIANDCIEKGADILLAPGVNMKRTPLCGRNFEYASEDPFLAGTMAKAYIEGVQSKGIGTSLKHYCANNREYDRLYQTSEIDERTLREIYLPAFEIAVQAQPWTVMCSYNPINGVYASENRYLLEDVLRDEFGFNGLIVSDWGAVHSNFRRVKAGLDLEMPYTEQSYSDLQAAYDKGLITDEEVDACAARVLELLEKTDNDQKTIDFTPEQRHENAVTIAKEGIVLLKNAENILPFKKGNILVSGNMAENPPVGGGGSAFVYTEYKQKNLAALLSEKLNGNAEVKYNGETVFYGGGNAFHVKATYQKAYEADAVVLCVGTDPSLESESFDRYSLKLPHVQEEFILRTAEVNENVVVIVYAGSAIDMSAWIDKVKAVVFAGFAGEGVNEALAAVLSGETVPSGKLAETFPLSLADTFTGLQVGNGFSEWYNDGIFVGYRYYDKMKKEVLFPFGHGLSYADFEYSGLDIKKLSETDYEISYNVTNVSETAAKEISEVYVKDVFAMVLRPEKELKGYSKDLIEAHETKRVTVKLDARSFAYYNTSMKKWHVENGVFEILIGASSRDIRLKGKINIELPETTQQSVK